MLCVPLVWLSVVSCSGRPLSYSICKSNNSSTHSALYILKLAKYLFVIIFDLFSTMCVFHREFPNMLIAFGKTGTFLVFASMSFAAFLFVVLCMVETSGLTLDEIEAAVTTVRHKFPSNN